MLYNSSKKYVKKHVQRRRTGSPNDQNNKHNHHFPPFQVRPTTFSTESASCTRSPERGDVVRFDKTSNRLIGRFDNRGSDGQYNDHNQQYGRSCGATSTTTGSRQILLGLDGSDGRTQRHLPFFECFRSWVTVATTATTVAGRGDWARTEELTSTIRSGRCCTGRCRVLYHCWDDWGGGSTGGDNDRCASGVTIAIHANGNNPATPSPPLLAKWWHQGDAQKAVTHSERRL